MATRTTVHDVIEDFRTASNVERGEKFERLMVDYFFLVHGHRNLLVGGQLISSLAVT